ncbi:MAG: 4Fe-4S binding protein [Deltaproteobacteria bacterium]|nr:4Fe-4S binding protein [Deltaproteobacteria bacterium]
MNKRQTNARGHVAAVLLFLFLVLVPITGPAADNELIFSPLDTSNFQPVNKVDFPPESENMPEEKKAPVSFSIPLISVLGIFLAALAARHERFRFTRHLFLLASLGYFGFYNGGCPCVISGFQNLILLGLGMDVKIINVVWFLIILLTAYFFGRIWCGWICHLGALQEFIFKTSKIRFLKSVRMQNIMNRIRYVLFAALIIQLIIMKENLFCHIDPFKTAFNMLASSTTSWVLLAVLIISSLFIYRPFCRAACPVGLLTGLIAKLPGALLIRRQNSCNECGRCISACNMQAIDKGQVYSSTECIACGDCIEKCKKQSLAFGRREIPPFAQIKPDVPGKVIPLKENM